MTIATLNRRWRPPVLLAIWAAAFILLWIDLRWLHDAASAALGGFVLLSLLDARRETWMVMTLIAGLGGILVLFGAHPGEVLHGLDRSLIFAALLPTLSLTRAVARGMPSVRAAQYRIAGLPQRWAGIGLLFGAHAFGSVLTTGAFALMSAVVPDDAPEADRRAAALATLRGMNTVALFSPFLVGFAVAYTYLPDVPVWQVFALGGALAAVGHGIGLAMFARPLSWQGVRAGLGCLAPIAVPMGGAAVLVVVASQLLPISTLGAVLVVMPALAALHFAGRPHRIAPVLGETRDAMGRLGDDLAIVSAAMILGTLAETAPPVRELVAPWIAAHLPPWAAFGVTSGSMILFALAGMHPMITGTVMMAAFAGSGLAIADLPLMLAMLFGWGLGSMNSISSLSLITAAQMFRVRPLGLAFGPNLLFTLVFGLLATAVLTLLNAELIG
ncbi:hypothetical protein [Thalassobaculum sp.]|uniref:hypothetical protein n=1 Tax=Thalassobaculum sp. TaxID=2022740 RepID=UPI0032EB2BC2